MSALRGKVVELQGRRSHEVLQRSWNGADNESTRSDLTSDGEADHVVAGGGDFRDQCSTDEAVETAVGGVWL
jgi:hypothetical protein